MSDLNIDRRLWCMTDDGRVDISQAVLQEKTEPLVILGEAGMGKSHLLTWLASFPSSAFCTANQLITRHDPKSLLGDASVLVIDGLDEVGAQQQGDAVNFVLQKLGALGYPRFILSCRVADWRSATGCDAIQEQYSNKPLELHLEPFTDVDAMAFLAATLGQDLAETVVKHFNDRGLNSLLGNPQTLDLISRVAKEDDLPNSRSELFAKAIEVLRQEHSNIRPAEPLAREIGLDAAGAAFASLILTGSEAIVRKAAANIDEGELELVELLSLPRGEAIAAMLGSRLFKAAGADRFSYLHRTIGEYLGAQWLAKQADTPRKRKRLLSLFHSHGLVPASLRGIHAWLAQDFHLVKDVIAADPMGVIDYGDADILTLENARLLIHSLERLAAENPHFRDWKPYSVRGIVQPILAEDVRRLIATKETPFGLRRLMLESVKGCAVAAELAHDLRNILFDAKEIYALRSDAEEALVVLRDAPADGYSEWIKVIFAEQKRARVETAYAPPKLDAINAILRNHTPVSASDLQALMLDELAAVQAKITSDDAESWRGFYDDKGVPFQEERCRDYLLGLLRQGAQDIVFDPEAHVAGDKEVDIACSVGALRLPIEIKGQWHPQLWQGADMQLDALYTGDWRADGRGIYLVLWFGNQAAPKRLTSPGRDVMRPETARELLDMLIVRSQSAKERRVAIFVLDLTRP